MGKNDVKIKELEDLIANSQYNKRTQKAIGQYKAQLAKLKNKEEARKSGGKAGDGYSVRKTGDGTVVLLGFPSAGKSTLLNSITGAESEVGAYAFTTLTCIPGVLDYKYAKIQILDVPGVVRGAASGKGRGTEVFAVLRSADLILLLIDVNFPEHYDVLLKEVYESGIRINQRRPDVKIKKTSKDGIKIGKTVRLTHLNNETITAVLKEFKIVNADVVIRTNITVDQLIDCIEDNKFYTPAITILNKVDTVSPEKARSIAKKIKADMMISAKEGNQLEGLKKMIFKKLKLIRIYMKEPRKKADLEEPLIVFENFTIKDVCSKLHKDFVKNFKFCRVWGKSAKFDGQKLTLRHKVIDGDIVEIHLK